MKKFLFGIKARYALLYLLSVSTILFLSFYFTFNEVNKKIVEQQSQRLKHIASTAALSIDQSDHKAIIEDYLNEKKNPYKTEHYIKSHSFLKKIKETNQLNHDVYTFYIPEWKKDITIFLVTSNEKGYLGNAVEVTDVVKKVMSSKKPHHSELHQTDTGKWISGVAPILNSKNEVLGAIAVNYNANGEVLRAREELLMLFLSPVFIAIILAIFVGGLTGRFLAAPIVRLAKASSQVASGNLKHIKLNWSQDDEIGYLYQNFKAMIKDLIKKEEVIKKQTELLEDKVRERTKNLEEKIQELKEYQEQLIESDKLAMVGSIAAGVGHEINNPLMIIKGHTDIIKGRLYKKEKLSKEQLEDFLKIIDNSIEQVSTIVNNLKQYCRNQKTESIRKIINFNELINDNINLIEGIYKSEGIEMVNEIPEETFFVNIVPSEIQQIFMNFLTNARDATEEYDHRVITTRLFEDNERVILNVSDNGTGIEEEVLKDIFNPFFTTKEIGKGTGLGLGICKSIAESMDGSLEISTEVGKGTTMSLVLPKSEGIREVKEKGTSTTDINLRLMNSRALLVEDDEAIRGILRVILEESGFEVEEASSAFKALDILEKSQFDFIFSDYKMPKMNGLDFIKKVRAKWGQKHKIIMVSGDLEIEMILKDNQFGDMLADGILSKPFSVEDLNELLKKITSESKAAS